MSDLRGLSIHITGIVQGVGFRPFVYNLATRLALTGWVRNTSAGVDIEVDGSPQALEAFLQALRTEAPPLARIDEFTNAWRDPNGYMAFEIRHSEAIPEAFQPISPDVAICADCLHELFDPHDRRYRYPFINCTNCGPRFTIIKDIPYDRPKTTMSTFPMCPDCAAEYNDPLNRRFHAQPVACPVCGPHVWLEYTGQSKPGCVKDKAVLQVQRLLAEGKIIAVKGLGGFHLACDAANPDAVSELRRRKLRVDKPFALMMPDLAVVNGHCLVNQAERALLESPARPILLLQRKPDSPIARQVAPGQDTLGVMLPYTPLHYLLFAETKQDSSFILHPSALVMTSGNLSEEPIATDNGEARQRLASLADAFLMHDRDIYIRCDDSVVRVFPVAGNENQPVDDPQSSILAPQSPILNPQSVYPLRRSRGYAPYPIHLPQEAPSTLATGAELKNTFCITNKKYAFLSHHIGDMENYETLCSFEQGIDHFERLFRVKPVGIAYDLHPNYLATRYALERAERDDIPAMGIQHHHAHIAACMAEHGLVGDRPVIGVAFDGTGFGEDGGIWGGEFLIADYLGYQRAAYLAYFPLPGGDAAIRRPARTALALLWSLGLDWDERLAPVNDLNAEERTALRTQLERKLNSPFTSSMGRLFDAAAALAGVRQQVNYEAQAAIEFEALAVEGEEGAYGFDITDQSIDTAPFIQSLVADVLAGVPASIVSARFHNGLASMVREVCRRLRQETSLDEVALSGGVWQNMFLLRGVVTGLRQDGFKVYLHQQVPTNDGGLSLGQAVIAAHRFKI
jgi:hydrogenase maturation protein HypF